MNTLTPEQLNSHARRLSRFLALKDLHTAAKGGIDPDVRNTGRRTRNPGR